MERDAGEWGGEIHIRSKVIQIGGVEAFVSLPRLVVLSVEVWLIILYSQYAHINGKIQTRK